MRLIVSDIPEEGLARELALPIALKDDVPPDTARISLKVRRHGNRVFINGRAVIAARFVCSRCLGGYSSPIDVSFSEEYVPAVSSEGETDHELTGTELALNYYSGDEIDVIGLVREQVLLSAPMKPLCREDCRGICPHCGKDLNRGDCGCRDDRIDPRLAPLKKLKETLK
jgi:uncharacterized protein